MRKGGMKKGRAKKMPGGAYQRNFNKPPTGKLPLRMGRPKHSRSKSRGA